MKKIFICLIVFIVTSSIVAQNKRDYIWIQGNDKSLDPGVQAFKFDFNHKPFEPEIRQGGLQFNRMNASICDENGNLLFYSNGCAVANILGEVMPNGDSINASRYFTEWWGGDCDNGHNGRQDILILPDPKNELGYFLIQKPIEYDPNAENRFLRRFMLYSYIDMSLDNGKGDVTIKNEPFFDGTMLASYLTAINHSNQKDWWIIQPRREPDAYAKFLITDEGVELYEEQSIGGGFHPRMASSSGEAKLSPDGTKYAYYNKYDGLYLFDFDRSTGSLSNYRFLNKEIDENLNNFSAVEFSPDSRFLYLASTDSLWQVDTEEANLADGEVLIDVYNGVEDPFPTTFFVAELGPDCRIYIRPGSSSRVFHVINKPNEKGKACDFVQQGLVLPFTSGIGSFPRHPRFRVDEEEKCDPSISTFLGEDVYYRRDLTVYPNPTSGPVTVEVPEGQKGSLHVLDIQGRHIGSVIHVDKYQGQVQIDASAWAVGTYSVEFVPDDNMERLIYTSWVIRQ